MRKKIALYQRTAWAVYPAEYGNFGISKGDVFLRSDRWPCHDSFDSTNAAFSRLPNFAASVLDRGEMIGG
jgi:hypothetical protein